MSTPPPPEDSVKFERIFMDIDSRPSIIIGIIIMILGFPLGLLLMWPQSHDLAMIEDGNSVTGIVFEIESKQGVVSNGQGVKRPTTFETIAVQYTVPGAGTYTFEGKGQFAEHKTKPEIGSEITVYYDVDKPNRSIIEGYEHSALIGGWVLFLSIVVPLMFFLNALPEKWHRQR